MIPRAPTADLPTHEVLNTPPHMGDQDLWVGDRALRHWVRAMGAGAHADHLAAAGRQAGLDATLDAATQANRFPPELRAFDRYGMRIDAVTFHPAWHDLMARFTAHGLHNYAWHHEGHAGHTAQAALGYLFAQPEGGALCPMAMTYSAVPALRAAPAIARDWLPRLLSTTYDPRDIPAPEKSGALLGMFMTEKQGGSDVRANTTRAVCDGDAYRLTGHKFFCSAPMCDAFLTLAQTDAGPSCFLMPRWRPDGTRNALHLQRLKDKLGNRSNASAEIELQGAHGLMVGDEGRGIRTIIDMVALNRMACASASAGIMRQALVQALHHTAHRSAFQKRLIDQPLMRNVLADLAIEAEAALALALRVARALDHLDNPAEAVLARIGPAVAKYWICKRAPGVTYEAMECHGGPGYIEDSILPRLYREAPVNSIWEGSGNIMGLDVLRALHRAPDTIDAWLDELAPARGAHPALDAAIDGLKDALADRDGLEGQMRVITERLALTMQGALLTRHGPPELADAFCASRLARPPGGAYGTLPKGLDLDAILARARPG
ncbi:acyl-CoA dehydrogenase family protein [Maribius pontilimi]|uniref:Acyl-CoA dehydrogenase family protein n=1 Tax=Palleronia pontilimi TaxID=1964209 RepID=A0A934MGU2_9RHOB|nr:acyl-CoA dehydrogenase family protein [Palleronia pontilimi]MBJ3762709.1 acyl-CoA dehydrogenase family protein [Palleronia pontilimi]